MAAPHGFEIATFNQFVTVFFRLFKMNDILSRTALEIGVFAFFYFSRNLREEREMCELNHMWRPPPDRTRSLSEYSVCPHPLLLGDVLGQGLFAGNRSHSVMHV
jgi:hypothetical protein